MTLDPLDPVTQLQVVQAVHERRLDDQENELRAQRERVEANTRALIGLAISVAGSSLVLLFSVLLATGKV